jgi:molybdenum cofactor cytidylyltransferase
MGGNSIFAVVLAAGEASRFGTTKQLAEFAGKPLVQRAVTLANSICGQRTVLVTGHDWQRVTDACAPLAGFFVMNEAYRSGIGGSLALAARGVAGVADAILVLLADQPLITRDHLDELIATWQASPGRIVATRYGDTMGPPAVFPGACAAELAELRGDRGAKSIIASADAVFVTFEPAAADIDRADDLERIQPG